MPDRAFTFTASGTADDHRAAVCDWVTSIGLDPNMVREFTLIDRNGVWTVEAKESTGGKVGDWQNRTLPVTAEDADRLLQIIGPAARYRLTRLPDPDDYQAMSRLAEHSWQTFTGADPGDKLTTEGVAAVVRALATDAAFGAAMRRHLAAHPPTAPTPDEIAAYERGDVVDETPLLRARIDQLKGQM